LFWGGIKNNPPGPAWGWPEDFVERLPPTGSPKVIRLLFQKQAQVVLDLWQVIITNELHTCILTYARTEMFTVEIHSIQEDSFIDCQLVFPSDRFKSSEKIM